MLSELLEDYQEYNEDEALDEFIDLLWSSNYGLRTYKKYYTFQVEPTALNNDEKLIEIFKPYQSTEIQYAKTYHKDKPDSIDMIRIHINNMYMYLTNDDVYLKKEYYEEKLKPRSLYYETIKKLKSNELIDADYIKEQLELSQTIAEKYKLESQLKKIKLDFNAYKELINDYIYRLFNNYKPPYKYEQEHGWELKASHDGWNEDNYVVKYFCKSLTGYMMNHVNKLKPKNRIKKCKLCDNQFSFKSSKKKYCDDCKRKLQLQYQRDSMKKLRNVK